MTEIEELRQRLIDLHRSNDYFTTSQCNEIDVIIDKLNEHWERENMAGKSIGAASVSASKSTGRRTVKPVDTAPKHARIARDNKADRAERAWLEATSKQYGHGRDAHAKGKTLADCPHDGRTKLARNWCKGWTDAASDAKKAARKRA